MAESEYTDNPHVEIEMTHPVRLSQSDLDKLVNGGELAVPVTLSSAVVLSVEVENGT